MITLMRSSTGKVHVVEGNRLHCGVGFDCVEASLRLERVSTEGAELCEKCRRRLQRLRGELTRVLREPGLEVQP